MKFNKYTDSFGPFHKPGEHSDAADLCESFYVIERALVLISLGHGVLSWQAYCKHQAQRVALEPMDEGDTWLEAEAWFVEFERWLDASDGVEILEPQDLWMAISAVMNLIRRSSARTPSGPIFRPGAACSALEILEIIQEARKNGTLLQ